LNPDVRTIENLTRLVGRDWFQDASVDDQYRSAEVVKIASQDRTGNPTIANNALDVLLTKDDLTLSWDYMQRYTLGSELGSQTANMITLNARLFPLRDPASPNEAKQLAKEGLPHEINHVLNSGRVEKSYRYFMDEYRAWYVGFSSFHGHPPSQEDCFGRAWLLVTATEGGYGRIGDAFRDTGSAESDNIVRFMARMIGADPNQATNASVLHPGALSRTESGPAPERVAPDDPNNLDDRSPN